MFYKNSTEFNERTKAVSTHLKNIPLRVLRLAEAKASKFSSVQAFCLFLDSQEDLAKKPTKNSSHRLSDFSTTVKDSYLIFEAKCEGIKQENMSRGIDAQNDYISSIFFGNSQPLRSPNYDYSKIPGTDTHLITGYIDLTDMSEFDLDEIIDKLPDIASTKALSRGIIATTENFIFNLIHSGVDISRDFINSYNFDNHHSYLSQHHIECIWNEAPAEQKTLCEKSLISSEQSNSSGQLGMKEKLAADVFKLASVVFVEYLLLECETNTLSERKWEKIITSTDFCESTITKDVFEASIIKFTRELWNSYCKF